MNNNSDLFKLNEEMLEPSIMWMAEQVPGGFFIYKEDEEQKLILIPKRLVLTDKTRPLSEARKRSFM